MIKKKCVQLLDNADEYLRSALGEMERVDYVYIAAGYSKEHSSAVASHVTYYDFNHFDPIGSLQESLGKALGSGGIELSDIQRITIKMADNTDTTLCYGKAQCATYGFNDRSIVSFNKQYCGEDCSNIALFSIDIQLNVAHTDDISSFFESIGIDF